MRRSTFTRLGTAGFMAAGAVTAALALTPGTASAEPCTMGIQPLNPFVQTCGIPNDPPVVRGAAPSQGAIIACKGNPTCLSYVVNGGNGFANNPNRP